MCRRLDREKDENFPEIPHILPIIKTGERFSIVASRELSDGKWSYHVGVMETREKANTSRVVFFPSLDTFSFFIYPTPKEGRSDSHYDLNYFGGDTFIEKCFTLMEEIHAKSWMSYEMRADFLNLALSLADENTRKQALMYVKELKKHDLSTLFPTK